LHPIDILTGEIAIEVMGVVSTFNNLDNRITVKEISSAIASPKNGKAKGLDLNMKC
jgi:hypothetical protein